MKLTKAIHFILHTSIYTGLFLMLFVFRSGAQDNVSTQDTVMVTNDLAEVTIRAFEQNRKLSDQPSAVFYLPPSVFQRFDQTAMVAAVNTIPGVRMQQRSPLSYRLDIRGSALRSPFGVRNVKIYYNDIPLTDPGGNTYLNALSVDDIHALTVIKGPAGSLYGSGTGGVVLIDGPLFSRDSTLRDNAHLHLETGSNGLQKISAGIRWGNNAFRYTDTKSNGYREYTAMHSRTAAYEALLKQDNRQQMLLTAHYADVYYQTPGALTKEEFDRNPKAARPAAGIYPSARENKAAVYQKNFLIGVSEHYRFNPKLTGTAVLYGAYTDFINPTIRNYEFRKEPHVGGRVVLQQGVRLGRVSATFWGGGEIQQGFFNVTDHENNKGNPAAMMNDDNIDNTTALAFLQAGMKIPGGWEVTAAASYHRASVVFKRLYPAPVKTFHATYDKAVSPRIALSKKLPGGRLIYLNASSGYSPPTVAELLPSTSVINTGLHAERGTSYEAGSRGFLLNRKLYYDADIFVFNLKKSIALRRDSSGADYFINAGGTRQHGAEWYVSYALVEARQASLKAWTSGSWFDFSYRDYRVADKDYSGKSLPGVAPFSLTAGLDFKTGKRFDAHLTYTYGKRIPLNDANDVYALPYHLLNTDIRYRWNIGRVSNLTVIGGVNNIFNEKYSLGDDINAVGGRYFNVAPGINVYLGLTVKYFL